jgi:hypothetical protein
MIAFIVTDLPDPLSPTSAICECAGMSRSTPFNTLLVWL